MELLKNFLEKELNITGNIVYENFLRYNELILSWNSKINVVSRKNTSIENIILNSLFFLKKFPLNPDSSLLDIGSGGGFPGIPLKIIYPQINILLCDSIGKKITVSNDIISQMNLPNIKTIVSRAEELYKSHKKKFDYVTARSVAPLHELYKWTKELIKENGSFIFIKGGDITEEISKMKIYKDISVNIIDYTFDEIYNIEDKKLVVIKKEKL